MRPPLQAGKGGATPTPALQLLHCYTTRAMSKREYTAAQMIEALEAAGGVVRGAARRLGCSAMTIYRYADRYVTVREALEAARSDTYAEAQAYLLAMMRDREHKDHKWAVEQVLKTYGDKISDGLEWSDKKRLEHSGPGGEEIVVNLIPNDEDDGTD